MIQPAAGPLDPTGRIRSLDALRGVALLGILWANVRQLFMPWDIADLPVNLGIGDTWAWLDWSVFHALVDLKFLTLFSLLFGISFALQAERLVSSGRPFGAIYARRLFILAMFGIAHGILLYPAEVLFPYAVAGFILLAIRHWPGHRLLAAGLWLLSVTLLCAYQLGSLGKAFPVVTAMAAILLGAVLPALRTRRWWTRVAVAVAVTVVAAVWMTSQFHAGDHRPLLPGEYAEARQQLAAMGSGDTANWPDEFRVRAEGSFKDLVALHAGQYGLILVYFAVLLLWRTAGLFMIGTTIHRGGLFAADSTFSWTRAARVGLCIGAPLSVISTGLRAFEIQGAIDWRWPEFLHHLGAFPLAAGIAGLVVAAVQSGAMRGLWRRIEAAGRMALTNYVAQSLVMSALAESWGLGLYGRLDGPTMTLLAWIAFATLAQASHFWLTRYEMGPLEWLWRCGTYWRWLPLARQAGSKAVAA